MLKEKVLEEIIVLFYDMVKCEVDTDALVNGYITFWMDVNKEVDPVSIILNIKTTYSNPDEIDNIHLKIDSNDVNAEASFHKAWDLFDSIQRWVDGEKQKRLVMSQLIANMNNPNISEHEKVFMTEQYKMIPFILWLSINNTELYNTLKS